MKLAQKLLLAGVASLSFAAAAPAFAQVVPGPGDFEDENPGTTFTGGDQTTTVGVDTDVTVGVDTDVNVEGDTNTNNNTNIANGGAGGQGGAANATGGSANNGGIDISNINASAPALTGSMSNDGCTVQESFSMGFGVSGLGLSGGRTFTERDQRCVETSIARDMLRSDNDQLVTMGVGAVMTIYPDSFGQSVPATANAAGAAEARCGQGASGNLFNTFNTNNYCLQPRAPQGGTDITVEVTNEMTGGDVTVQQPAAPAAVRRGATGGARRPAATGGQVVSQGTIDINGQQCTVTVRCPAPGNR